MFDIKINLSSSLYPVKWIKFNQSEGTLIKTTLIGWNKVGISKKREKKWIKQKSKVSIVNIKIKILKYKMFDSGHLSAYANCKVKTYRKKKLKENNN